MQHKSNSLSFILDTADRIETYDKQLKESSEHRYYSNYSFIILVVILPIIIYFFATL